MADLETNIKGNIKMKLKKKNELKKIATTPSCHKLYSDFNVYMTHG